MATQAELDAIVAEVTAAFAQVDVEAEKKHPDVKKMMAGLANAKTATAKIVPLVSAVPAAAPIVVELIAGYSQAEAEAAKKKPDLQVILGGVTRARTAASALVPLVPLEPVVEKPKVITIDSLSVDKPKITEGDPVVVLWTTTNATSVTLEGKAYSSPDGQSEQLFPAASYTYTLVAQRKGSQDVRAQVSVTVVPKVIEPPIVQTIDVFTVKPSTVNKGEMVVVEWATSNATDVLLDGVSLPPEEMASGTRTLDPIATRTFTIVAKRTGMPDVTKTADVIVQPIQPPVVQTIDSFTATPAVVDLDDDVTLAWSTTNADQVLLEGASMQLSGSVIIRPPASRSYKLVAKRSGMPDVEKSVSVTVTPVVVVPPVTGSLSEVGAALAPGTWGLVDSIGISESLVSDGPNTDIPIYYCNSAPWNPVAKTIDIIGADHQGPIGLFRYHDSNNTWDAAVPCRGLHGYNQTAVDNDGRILRLICAYYDGTAHGIFVIHPDGSDEFIVDLPENLRQNIAAGAIAWCGDSLGLYSGNSHVFYLLNMATLVWTPVATAPIAGGLYHCVAAYSAKFDCCVFGGGNEFGAGESKRLWKYDMKLGTLTELPTAPHPVGIMNGSNLDCGTDGNIYILGFGEHWIFDLAASKWEKLATPPEGTLFPNTPDAVISINTPHGLVYIMGRAANGVRSYQMRVYKASAGPPQPQLEPVIDTFTASRSTITLGEKTKLQWTTTNADDATLNGYVVVADGEFECEPTQSGAWTLIARRKDAADSVPQIVNITVLPHVEPIPPNIVPTRGSVMESARYAQGPADWVDVANLPAPVPWTTYFDAANQVFAPSQKGVRPANWVQLCPWGAQGNLYNTVPIVKNGRIIQYSSQRAGADDLTTQAMLLKADPPPVGARGVGLVDPFITWHGHRTLMDASQVDNPSGGLVSNLRMALYMGIRADGAMVAAMRNGSTYIQGYLPAVTSPAQDWSFFRPNKVKPGAGEQDDTKIFFVCYLNGRILKVDRKAAAAAQIRPAVEDYRLWIITEYASVGSATSIRCTPDGTMYVCDNIGNRILKIPPDGGTPVELMQINRPFFIDYTSTGKLVVLTSDISGVYVIDPANPVLGQNLMPEAERFDLLFGTLSVDRHGTIGPVDEFYMTRSHSNTNTDLFRFTLDGQFDRNPFANCDGGIWNADPHYPWVGECHPDQAVFLNQGFGNAFPRLLRAGLPSDPPWFPHNDQTHWLWNHGVGVFRVGSVAASPVGLRPSFHAIMNGSGWSNIGCTADYIAEMSYSDAVAFVQNGMIGSFPRPEIVGHDLKALMFVIYLWSQRYCREGAPLIDGLLAYIEGLYPNAPITERPAEPDYSSLFASVVTDGAGFRITLHDRYWSSPPIDPATVMRIVADKGMPTEKVLGTVSAPSWRLPTRDLLEGPHGLSVEFVSGQLPIYAQETNIIEIGTGPIVVAA